VFLADLDPQQSSSEWWRRRGGPDNPMLLGGRGTVLRRFREIEELRGQRDVMILDTPGAVMGGVQEATKMADCVVVVVQPSIKDLEAQGAMRDLIDQNGQRDRSLYMVNRVDGRSNLGAQAAAVIRDRSPHEPFQITDRIDYVRADAVGKVGNEISKAARVEILGLWEAIVRITDEHRSQ
jgi:cellulose biosynthesis protein BcsQ